MKPVVVKRDPWETGVGSVVAERLWESEVNSEGGDFCHLARTPDGKLHLSWTDMEEFDGSYISTDVTEDDIRRLASVLPSAITDAQIEAAQDVLDAWWVSLSLDYALSLPDNVMRAALVAALNGGTE